MRCLLLLSLSSSFLFASCNRLLFWAGHLFGVRKFDSGKQTCCRQLGLLKHFKSTPNIRYFYTYHVCCPLSTVHIVCMLTTFEINFWPLSIRTRKNCDIVARCTNTHTHTTRFFFENYRRTKTEMVTLELVQMSHLNFICLKAEWQIENWLNNNQRRRQTTNVLSSFRFLFQLVWSSQ